MYRISGTLAALISKRLTRFISFIEQHNRVLLYGIAVLWAFMQAFFLWNQGIVISGEAEKYIYQAGQLLEYGRYSSSNYLFYSTLILFIAFCLKMQAGFGLIVFLQILLNGISIICFYRTIRHLSVQKWLPTVATLYFLILYYFHVYNTFIYTESLFFSLSIIYTWLLLTTNRLTLSRILLLFLLLTLCYFTRPTGIYFLPATFLFVVLKFYPQQSRIILWTAGPVAAVILFILFNQTLGSGGGLDFMVPYIHEQVICGVSTISKPHQFDIAVNPNSVQGLAYFVIHHTDLFSKLALKRLSAFFGASRTFYSLGHNIFVSVYFYSLYAIILMHLRSLSRHLRAEKWFFLTNIILMTVTVMLSCDEWSNRFLFSVTPSLLMLAAIALGKPGRTN